jgi:hypothetical protein
MKTKEGLQKIADLLKGMENRDMQAVKHGIRAKFYHFDWYYYELGMTRDTQ